MSRDQEVIVSKAENVTEIRVQLNTESTASKLVLAAVKLGKFTVTHSRKVSFLAGAALMGVVTLSLGDHPPLEQGAIYITNPAGFNWKYDRNKGYVTSYFLTLTNGDVVEIKREQVESVSILLKDGNEILSNEQAKSLEIARKMLTSSNN